jgi:hypothetical protein
VRLEVKLKSDFNQTESAESATLLAPVAPSAIDSLSLNFDKSN